jgi:hypothetical protein
VLAAKNKFQNPQISRKTLRLSPERSTLVVVVVYDRPKYK